MRVVLSSLDTYFVSARSGHRWARYKCTVLLLLLLLLLLLKSEGARQLLQHDVGGDGLFVY